MRNDEVAYPFMSSGLLHIGKPGLRPFGTVVCYAKQLSFGLVKTLEKLTPTRIVGVIGDHQSSLLKCLAN